MGLMRGGPHKPKTGWPRGPKAGGLDKSNN